MNTILFMCIFYAALLVSLLLVEFGRKKYAIEATIVCAVSFFIFFGLMIAKVEL